MRKYVYTATMLSQNRKINTKKKTVNEANSNTEKKNRLGGIVNTVFCQITCQDTLISTMFYRTRKVTIYEIENKAKATMKTH